MNNTEKNKSSIKNILIIAAQEEGRMPGQRFRIEQYFKFLNEQNFKCNLSPLFNSKEVKILYSQGQFIKKILLIIKSIFIRYKDLKKVKKGHYDLIYIYRDALLIKSIFFEKKFKKTNTPIVYDFDDAIWLPDVSDANKKFAWLKNPNKTKKIIELSDLIITGNKYLANYAKQFNKNTIIIPTTVNTEQYKASDKTKDNNKPVVIGWLGSLTTIKHLKTVLPALKRLKQKYQDKIDFSFIGDGNFFDHDLDVSGKWWNPETELKDLSKFDIGIMPLPDDKWSKGKCGLKGLLYMSISIPAIISPVGVNVEIIDDGINGMLASTEDEWIEKISMLIDSEELRKTLGEAGRKTVIEKYSFEAQKENWLNAFQSLTDADK